MPKALCKQTGAVVFILVVLSGVLYPSLALAQIEFPDENLEEVIRLALKLEPDEDITLSKLQTLTSLNGSSRSISDLTYLHLCTNLQTLTLYNNSITNISPLKDLPLLQDVYLWDNQISDITPLADLSNLRFVFLHNNQITDISCLMDNPSWNDGDILNVSGMFIDQYGLCDVIPHLEDLGVVVYKDDSAICNENIRVEIPDPALEEQLRWALNLRNTEFRPYLFDTDLAKLTFFIANDCGIKNLKGLEFCVNLKSLSLNGNEITDIWPIANMSYLETLMLSNNQIEDISPISELYGLTELALDTNNISNITPLQALGGLVWLYLNDNEISDVTALRWLLNLRVLALDHNELADIAPLSRLTELIQLSLNGNALADLTPLAPLENLKFLHLASNGLVDLSPLSGLVGLTLLDASDNAVEDINSLYQLRDLVWLYLHDNQIKRGVTVLAGFPELSIVTLANNGISDISPLVANAGLGHSGYLPQVRDMVDVRGNKLSIENICNDIPALRERNVIVKTDEEQVCDPFAASYTLTMAVEGNGAVDPEVGSRRYAGGTRITLSATPDEGFEFIRWKGDLETTENPVEIVMDSDKLITAVFAETSVKYTLTVEAVGSGTVEPPVGNHEYANQTQVTVTATPSFGWVFDHWEGDLSGTVNPQSVEMTEDKLVRAVFVEQGPPQTLRIYITGNGTTEPEPGSHEFPKDEYVSIVALPDLGYKFDHWEGDLSGTAPQNVIQMTGPKSVRAVFVADDFDYTLAVGVAEGGTIDVNPPSQPPECPSCSPGYHRYDAGQTVTLTAHPDENYVFERWFGAITSTENPLVVTMDSDKSLTAVFQYAPVRYSLSVGAMPGGITSPPPGEYLYAAGAKVTVSAIPDEGFEFDHWEGDYAGTEKTVLVTMSGNVHMQAFFKPYPFLTAVTPSKGTTLGGDTVTITGGRLNEATEVWFDEWQGAIAWRDYDEIGVVTPPHPMGVANIVVVTPQGETDPLVSAFMFVEPPGPPEFGEVIPPYGAVAGQDSVLIRGQNLQLAQEVLFGGQPAHIVSSTESRLSVVTPAHAAGAVDVQITTTTGTATGANGFTYLAPPQVFEVSPNQGQTSGGQAVTITGTDLGQAFEVIFDVEPADVISRSATQLVVTAPPHAAGIVDLLVMTPGGVAIAQGAYTYYNVGGAILCRVADSKDLAPINDATVRLNTGSLISGSPDGDYLFNNLPPGTYQVSIITANCGTQNRGVTVTANQQATLNVMMYCEPDEPASQCQSPVKRLNANIAETTVPLSMQDSPTNAVCPEAALAIRLTAAKPIDPDSAWAYAEADGWTGAGGVWRSAGADGRDGWVVFTPEEPMPAGQAVKMTVGASTVEGVPVGPVAYDFAVQAAGGAVEEPAVVEAADIPALPVVLAAPKSKAYRIEPAEVYDAPVSVLIPIPEVAGGEIDVYYYSESIKHPGWYAAENVKGFAEPGSRRIVEIDGQHYVELQVNHGGIVQLGQAIRMKLGSAGGVEVGFGGSKAGWLALLGVVAALAYLLKRISRKPV